MEKKGINEYQDFKNIDMIDLKLILLRNILEK